MTISHNMILLCFITVIFTLAHFSLGNMSHYRSKVVCKCCFMQNWNNQCLYYIDNVASGSLHTQQRVRKVSLCDHKRGFCHFPCLNCIWLTAVQPWQILHCVMIRSALFFYPIHLPDPLLSCCSLWFLSLLNALLRANGFKTFFKCLSLQSCCRRPWGLFWENGTSCSSPFCYCGELCQMNEKHNCIPCTFKSSITLAINGIRASVLLSDSISMPQWVFLP